jgi:hypothetical protein
VQGEKKVKSPTKKHTQILFDEKKRTLEMISIYTKKNRWYICEGYRTYTNIGKSIMTINKDSRITSGSIIKNIRK